MILGFDEYKSRNYFPALDGIRAISILLVVTVHLYYQNFSWRWLAGEGGVRVFFVLSGYLITMLALREEERAGRLNVKAFYVRRAFRIFPLYFLVLGIYCLLILGLGAGGENDRTRFLAALPYYMAYVNEYAPPAPFYQSWSLGIEEKFYFVWPLLGFVALANRTVPRMAVSVLLIVALISVSAIDPQTQLIHYYPILLGCLLALLLNARARFDFLKAFGRSEVTLVVWGAFVVAQLALDRFPIVWYAYPLVVGLVLLNTIMVEPRWLRWRPLTFIGERAYGIYLVHILCLRTVKIVFPSTTTSVWVSLSGLVAGTALSCLVAEGLRRGIETPFIRMGRNLVSRSRGSGIASMAG